MTEYQKFWASFGLLWVMFVFSESMLVFAIGAIVLLSINFILDTSPKEKIKDKTRTIYTPGEIDPARAKEIENIVKKIMGTK